MKFVHQEVRKYDSSAQVGMSTPLWNFYFRCYDWPAIMSVCSFATPYGPLYSSDFIRF